MTLSNPAQYISGRTVEEQMNNLIDYVDVRAAEVATDAIASDVAQVHQDKLDADADALAAAASAAAAASTLTNAVKKTGETSQSIAGDVAVAGTLSGGVVTGTVVTVPTPTNNTDAATKKYVDDADALKLNITDVNTYALGLTGNQTASGIKTLKNVVIGNENAVNYQPIAIQNARFPTNTTFPASNSSTFLCFTAADGSILASIRYRGTTSGDKQLWLDIAGTDGNLQSFMLGAVTSGNVLVKGWNI